MTALPPPGTDDPLVGQGHPGFEPMAEVASGPEARHRFWRSFLTDRWAMAGLAFLVVVIAAAVFAPLVAPENYSAQDLVAINAGPSIHHLFGTDDLGRDVLSRIIWGGRVALTVGFLSVTRGAMTGVVLGLISGFFGGWIRRCPL